MALQFNTFWKHYNDAFMKYKLFYLLHHSQALITSITLTQSGNSSDLFNNLMKVEEFLNMQDTFPYKAKYLMIRF